MPANVVVDEARVDELVSGRGLKSDNIPRKQRALESFDILLQSRSTDFETALGSKTVESHLSAYFESYCVHVCTMMCHTKNVS